MNKKIIIAILSLLGAFIAQAQDGNYAESLVSDQVTMEYVAPQAESIRLKKAKATKFQLKFEAEEDYSIERKAALDVALKYWEEKLPSDNSIINIEVIFSNFNTPLVSSRTVVVDKSYQYLGNSLVYFPNSLLKSLNKDVNTAYASDILITYNTDSDINWYYGTDGEVPAGSIDFVTETMRSIAKGLGFYTPVTNRRGRIAKKNTIFSTFLEHNNQTLNDNTIVGNELNNFSTCNDVYWNGIKAGRQKMYAPTTFVSEVSLGYFDVDANNDISKKLMKPMLDKGQAIHNIGDKILDVLSDMGWKTPTNDLEITSTNIEENGAMMLNNNYSFSATAGWGNITQYDWSFEIMNDNGNYIVQSQSSEPTFDVTVTPPNAQNSSLARLSNGALRGRIKLTTVSASGFPIEKYFYVTILYRPGTPHFRIVRIIPRDEWYDDVEVEFYADGATHYGLLHDEVDMDYITVLGNIAKKGYNKFMIYNVYKSSTHIFKVRAANSYGITTYDYLHYPLKQVQAVETIVIGKNRLRFDVRNSIKNIFNDILGIKKREKQPKENTSSTILLNDITIFNTTGQMVFQQTTPLNTSEILQLPNLNNGVYIVKMRDSNNNIYSSKFYLQ